MYSLYCTANLHLLKKNRKSNPFVLHFLKIRQFWKIVFIDEFIYVYRKINIIIKYFYKIVLLLSKNSTKKHLLFILSIFQKRCTVMPYRVNRIHDFDIKCVMTIVLNNTCNPLICTILFGLSESYEITLFKDFILEIIKVIVTEKSKKKHFPQL